MNGRDVAAPDGRLAFTLFIFEKARAASGDPSQKIAGGAGRLRKFSDYGQKRPGERIIAKRMSARKIKARHLRRINAEQKQKFKIGKKRDGDGDRRKRRPAEGAQRFLPPYPHWRFPVER